MCLPYPTYPSPLIKFNLQDVYVPNLAYQVKYLPTYLGKIISRYIISIYCPNLVSLTYQAYLPSLIYLSFAYLPNKQLKLALKFEPFTRINQIFNHCITILYVDLLSTYLLDILFHALLMRVTRKVDTMQVACR